MLETAHYEVFGKIDMTADIHTVIEFLAKRRGFDGFQELAKKGLNMHPSTFSSNLNRIKTSGNLESSFALELAERLGVSVDQLREVLSEKKIFDPYAHRLLAEQKIRELEPFNEKYAAEIRDLISRLHKGDIYILATCYRPYEYDGRKLRTTILHAIKAGVKFKYVFPQKELFDNLKKYVTPDLRGYDQLTDGLTEYRNKLKEELEPDKLADESVKSYPCNDPFLISPFTKLIFLERQIFGVTEEIVFAEARIGNVNNDSVQKLWYPLPHYDAYNIVSGLRKTIK